jgi:hypothetical protein
VVAKMKEMPTDDPLFGKGTIRIDGRKITRRTWSRSRNRPSRRDRGTTTRSGRRFPRTRRSVR